ncbi:hypothetical protein [Bernardetia sp.]|uniref:hypothetical protein n=1 Tax=Bernardetia sp. TaxID=1937974 RepID=UPI0025C38AD9|nr:hypothetical protein [Bernardetia sp.]
MKNILVKIGFVLCFYLLTTASYSQKLNTVYVGYSSDSLSRTNGLTFENDSILEFHYVPFHIGYGRYYVKMKYEQKDNIIYIEKANIEMQDTFLLKNIPSYYFEKDIVLEIDEKAIIDKKDNRVYVKQKDIRKNKHKMVFVFNGKEYRQYSRKERKRLAREIKLEDSIDYNITIYKGLEAYLKYGYEAVLGGVIEIEEKGN